MVGKAIRTVEYKITYDIVLKEKTNSWFSLTRYHLAYEMSCK